VDALCCAPQPAARSAANVSSAATSVRGRARCSSRRRGSRRRQ
jgi:hypothetical protein